MIRTVKPPQGAAIPPILAVIMISSCYSQHVVELGTTQLSESSGIAVGRHANVLWTHNDSGDGPNLYALDRSGKLIAKLVVDCERAIDWEDICSFEHNGKAYLAIGDFGDNLSKRDSVSIYVLEEPTTKAIERGKKIPVVCRFNLTYDEGPVDCEALCYDAVQHAFVVASKELFRSRIYTFPIPAMTGSHVGTFRKIGTALLPMVTGGDISPNGQQLVLCTYGPGCLVARSKTNKDLKWRFGSKQDMSIIDLPKRQQGESICFDQEGKNLWLTSEKLPTPLISIPVPKP